MRYLTGNVDPVPLTIHLAGRLEVSDTGVLAELDGLGQLGRVALAYLVVERRRAVTHGELAEAMWGDRLPRTWQSALRGVVARLRTLFGRVGLVPDEIIVTTPGSYRLVLPLDAEVDLEVALTALRRAERSLESGDARRAVEQSALTSSLTAQPLLPGAEGSWVDRQLEQWSELRLSAMLVHAASLRQIGETAESIIVAERLVALDPLRESSYLSLMASHAQAGNRALALRSLSRCRAALVEYLGIEPSLQTQRAYLDLLSAPRSPNDDGDDSRFVPAILDRLRRGDLPFVGRGDPLAELMAIWADVAAGNQRVAVVQGDSGMGKTRLASELAASLAPGSIVLYGARDADGVVPYQPFVEAFRSEVTDAATTRTELSRLFPHLVRRPDGTLSDAAPGDGNRFELFEAMTALVRDVSERAPVLLVLDDVQWFDRPTMLMLRHVMRQLGPSGRILLLLLTRTVTPDLVEIFDSLPSPTPVHAIELDPLDLDAVRELSFRVLGASADEVANRVLDETDGSPFLVGELLRQFASSTTQGAPPVPSTGDPDEPLVARVGVPPRVVRVLEGQLGMLELDARQVLRVAAIAGQVFDLAVVEHVIEAQSDTAQDDAVLAALEAGMTAGLVVEHRHEIGRFAFTHSLVRQVLIDETIATRRSIIHRRLAIALEEGAGGPIGTVLGDLLRHHRGALVPDSDPRPLAECAARVAAEALRSLAYEDAVDQLAATIASLDKVGIDDPAITARLMLAMGEACDCLGDRERARASYASALAAARRAGDAIAMGEAALGIGGPWTPTGRIDEEQVQALEEALSRLDDSATDSFRAVLLARLTRAVRYAPGFERRGPILAAEALAVARRSGNSRALSSALLAQRVVLHGPDGVHERLVAANELHELVTARGDSVDKLEAAPLRIMALFEAGDHERSHEAVEQFGELADASLRPYFRWCAEYLRAVVATRSGRFADAEGHIVQARDLGLDAQLPDTLTVYSTQLVMLRRDEARVTELEALITEMNSRIEGRPWNAVLAWVMAQTDRVDEAQALLPRRSPVRRDPLWLANAALDAETIARIGAADRAADLYDELAPYAGIDIVIGPGVAWIGPVDHFLGALAACAGRRATARLHFDRAIASMSVLGRCPALARSELALAEV
jgi:DNA-binding SARP family transcriptional activator/tetratricopeptide (TPR) repeat protein